MRQLLFICFALLFTFHLSAQNWQPIHTNDSILQFIYSDSVKIQWISSKKTNRPIQTIVVDSTFMENGVIKKCFKKGFSLIETYIDLDTTLVKGRLLGDTMSIYPDSSVFSSIDPNGFRLVFPHSYYLNKNWEFARNKNYKIMANVDSIIHKKAEFFGFDSTVIISLQVFDHTNNIVASHHLNSSLEISKNYGIIILPDFTSNSKQHIYHRFSWAGSKIFESETKNFNMGDEIVFVKTAGIHERSSSVDTIITQNKVISQTVSSNMKIIEYSVKEWHRNVYKVRWSPINDTIYPIANYTKKDTLYTNIVYKKKFSGILNEKIGYSITSPQFVYSNAFSPDSILSLYNFGLIYDSSSQHIHYKNSNRQLENIVIYQQKSIVNILGSFKQHEHSIFSSSKDRDSSSYILKSVKNGVKYITEKPLYCELPKPKVNINQLYIEFNKIKYSWLIDSTSINYQWINCSSNFLPIQDSTHSTLTPNNPGFYSVKANWADMCIDTSACVYSCDFGDSLIRVDFNKLFATIENASYQWVDCDNNYKELSGETNKSITPQDSNDRLAVILNVGNCFDTSRCITVVGINEQLPMQEEVIYYPNPVKEDLNISMDPNDIQSILIYNAKGQIILNPPTSNRLNLGSLNPGIYFIRILTNQNTFSNKFIKK